MNQTSNQPAMTTPTARVTAARLAIRAARPRRLTSTLLWAVQIPLAALFMLFALLKLGGGLKQEFDLVGVGQWLKYVAGTAELAGAIGLLTPGRPGRPPPGWPPSWPARPSSTPPCCTTPHTPAWSS